jgi:hypothetical protein
LLVQVRDELGHRFAYGWDGDVVLVGWVHDELVACCRPEIADEIGAIMVRWAEETGEHYGFRCALDADYKIGTLLGWRRDGTCSDTAPTLRTHPRLPKRRSTSPRATAHMRHSAKNRRSKLKPLRLWTKRMIRKRRGPMVQS